MKTSPGPTDHQSGIGPPRFGLRSLLLFMTAVCIVLAVHIWAGPLPAVAVAFFLITIFAHMASTWLGNQLRASADRQTRQSSPGEGLSPASGRVEPFQHGGPVELEPTCLRHHTAIGWQTVVGIACGVLAGAITGSLLIQVSAGPRLSWFGFLYGVMAFMVLGGLAGFAAASFSTVLWRAWREATRLGHAPRGRR